VIQTGGNDGQPRLQGRELGQSSPERGKGQGQDLGLLLRYLSLSRDQRYRLEARTAHSRDKVSLLFRETRRERRPLAVEWHLLTKADLVRAACGLRSDGVPVRFGWHKMSLSTLGLLMEKALAEKVSQNSLDDLPAVERVLAHQVCGVEPTPEVVQFLHKRRLRVFREAAQQLGCREFLPPAPAPRRIDLEPAT
jgi:hypothetical protein